jgi:hypothetical protein
MPAITPDRLVVEESPDRSLPDDVWTDRAGQPAAAHVPAPA